MEAPGGGEDGPQPAAELTLQGGAASVGAATQVFVDDLGVPALSAEDAHHLSRVLRLRPGELVVAADGEGAWRACHYAGAPGPAGATAGLEVAGPVEHEESPAELVTVGFVPVKGDRPEWVVQKLTELGVDRIWVLGSGRAVVRWEGERARQAVGRLRRVAREAAAQSRRARLPLVDGVGSLGELAASLAPEPLALAQPGGTTPWAGLRSLAVGPEGGWEEAERRGRPTVGLGSGVLRAETAAVAGAALLCALRDGLLVSARPSAAP